MANQDRLAESEKAATASSAGPTSWGVFEPLHGVLGPVATAAMPLWSTNVAVLVTCILLFMTFFRSPSPPSMLSHDIGCPGYTLPQRLAAYEEMWRREESELWTWLEDRVGMNGMVFPTADTPPGPRTGQIKYRGARELAENLRENKMSDREMDHAIRTTRERLNTLEEMLKKQKAQWAVPEEAVQHEL